MRLLRTVAFVLLLAGLSVASLSAHHSFAVFFDDTKTLTIAGTVTEFRFTNPHGLITLTVEANGTSETWRVETNAPTLLRRRGWTADSLTPGDRIVVDGWQSRDGAKFLRMRSVTRADGAVIGTAATAPAPRGGGAPR
jgi:hypothetical protein